MKHFKEEFLALAGTIAVVMVGSLAFVTLTMPFVFPFAVVAAAVLLWRHVKRPAPAPGRPVARPPWRSSPPANRHGPRPVAV
jgi:hypothetical protein